MSRYLSKVIEEFAQRKFVFLAGPRQVGKTTLGKEWLNFHSGKYLNWDSAEDRESILKKTFLSEQIPLNFILLDEIHKYSRWKNYIKGLFDKEASQLRVLVTGSARLNIYNKGGDSLFGRYELLRLHPFSIGELTHGEIREPPDNWLTCGKDSEQSDLWNQLEKFGGFPEPFHQKDLKHHQRWSIRRRELLINEDLRDLSEIKLISLVEHLYLLLPERVGAPLSVNSLKEELQVAYNSVAQWLLAFEHLYICYRLAPYHNKVSRSLKKEQKLYLWDWSQISDPAARFENMVASHLLKSVHAWTDLGYGEFDLMYWRNKEKEEVDFVITKNRKPCVLFECKLTDQQISKSLIKLSSELGNIPALQLVHNSNEDFTRGQVRVVGASKYLASLI